MSGFYKHSVKGFYKDHYCRSLHEFHACLYFDLVKKFPFIMEPFRSRSSVSKQSKIPDMAVFDTDRAVLMIVEIKQSEYDIIDLAVDYASNKYRIPDQIIEYARNYNVSIEYHFFKNCKISLKDAIINAIGYQEYENLLNTYKEQRTSYTGFSGKMNPMYGKKHTDETRALISKKIRDSGMCVGENNPMFGQTHTTEARTKIGAKWHDGISKNNILKNSILNKLTKMSIQDLDELGLYVDNIKKGMIPYKLESMNGCKKISKELILDYFGSFEAFKDIIKEVYCVKQAV